MRKQEVNVSGAAKGDAVRSCRSAAKNCFLVSWIAATMLLVLIVVGCAAEQSQRGGKQTMVLTPHPGKIKFVDLSTNTSREVSFEEVPERGRFVYLKNGVETDPHDATERVPIVEVEMLPLDRNGNIVPKDKATTIQIKEFGPNRRPLRSSTMIKE